MKIIKTKNVPESVINGEYHILTFAETGFSILNVYAQLFGVPETIIEQFSQQSNQSNEAGTLYPKAPISVIPHKYIRDLKDKTQLEKQIIEFLNANQKIMRAKKIIFDFGAGVDSLVIQACEKALQSTCANNIDEAIIINEN